MKLIQKIKNREKRPMSEKKKSFLKGLLFGSIAGAVLSFVIVGVVGCSVGKADNGEEPKTSAKKGAFNASSYNGTTWTFVDEPDPDEGTYSLSFECQAGVFYGLSCLFDENGLTITYADSDQADDVAYSQVLGGWFEGYQTITLFDEPSSRALGFLQTWATMGQSSSSSAESSSSEETSSSESSASNETSSGVSLGRYEEITAPVDYWPYRLVNGSPDTNTGGVITASGFGDTYLAGAVRLGGVVFALGDGDSLYDAIEFQYMTIYQQKFVNESGEIKEASSETFKNVLYLQYIRVLSLGSDASDQSAWSMIAQAYWGMDDSGNLYLNAHRINWLDSSYKNFRVAVSDASATSNIAFVGGFSSTLLNPVVNDLNRSEAMRLALTGSSAVNGSSVVLGGNGNADVFGLLSSTFGSIGSILGISLIPGLTLGTLMFIPLVVLVIFAIIKILNK